ncbi:MAG: ABC transporter [Sideroxydans sp.]|nr:ABC transporter [Sideroxydans sp.]
MKLPRPNLLLKNLAFAALLLVAAVALYQFTAHHPLQHDITQNASNSLEPTSVQVLQQLHGPVTLTVFSTRQDAKQGDIHKLVRNFVSLYQRYKPDITLSFIDPAQHPDEVRKADVQNNGEMVVEYGGRREHLTMLNEQALTSALLNLAHRKQQLVMYLDGHGERKLEGGANFDLGLFGQRLQQNGFRINALNLAVAQDVPSNASLLIITQPQVDLMPGELDKLTRYVDGGGNLLWLMDAEPLHGLEQLAEKLGLALTPGIVIDPDAQQMRAPTTWALAAGYPPHPITRNFNLVTVFPYARALDHEDSTGWQYHSVVEAAPRGWVSRNTPREGQQPHFNKNHDVPGPVTVALALRRNINDRDQRIVVVGSGAFLANTYAGNGGNLDLGVNMVNWLANEEKLITIQPRAAKDSAVNLSKRQLSFISIGFVIVLPLLRVLSGGVLWWRRRS